MNPRAKIPGPDHPITITPNAKRVKVTLNGQVIAESTKAMTLREANYPPVQYIPRADANMALLTKTGHSTFCPYKGDAGYFTVNAGTPVENAIWTYEAPYDAVKAIAGHLAFYPNKVTIEEI